MRCCVIGGAGFVGAHVTAVLANSGREVTVIGRRREPRVRLPAGVRYESGDYSDLEFVRAALRRADAVIDLAYSTVPKTSFEDPIFDIASNLPASVQLLREAAEAGIRKLVLVSSGGTVYGNAASLPIQEDHPTDPVSPYGITKLTIEKYAGMIGLASGLPIVVVRPGNAYGEGQRAFSGQGFIATAMYSIIEGRAIVVFGRGDTIRDYVHVSDIATGIVAALDFGQAGQIYNIGTGVGTSNIDVLRTIEPLALGADLKLRTETLPERAFDVRANVLDSRKLAAVAGWSPVIDFTHGIARTWRSVLDDRAT